MSCVTLSRRDLKRMCLEAFGRVALEHPAGHQGAYAARYVLYSDGGERIEFMFEKASKRPANVWFESRHALPLHSSSIEMRDYPAAAVDVEVDGKKRYSRHSALKPMARLRNASLVKVRIDRPDQIALVIDALRSA